jgi:hypothetical protein
MNCVNIRAIYNLIIFFFLFVSITCFKFKNFETLVKNDTREVDIIKILHLENYTQLQIEDEEEEVLKHKCNIFI